MWRIWTPTINDMTPFATPMESAIAAQLHAEAKQQKVSQTELAKTAGVGREVMNAYLNGRAVMPLNVLIAVCDRLGITLHALALRAEAQLER